MQAVTCPPLTSLLKRAIGATALLVAVVVIGGTIVGWGIIGLTAILGD